MLSPEERSRTHFSWVISCKSVGHVAWVESYRQQRRPTLRNAKTGSEKFRDGLILHSTLVRVCQLSPVQ